MDTIFEAKLLSMEVNDVINRSMTKIRDNRLEKQKELRKQIEARK